MKLRYYLRGLGIGIVVTALLMGVALKGDQPLSDAEIRARATALGMVDGDARTLADIQASQESGMSLPEEQEPTDASMNPAASTPTPAPTPEASSDPAPTASPDSEVVDPLKPLPMVTLKPPQTDSPESDTAALPVPESAETVTFVISSGQSSYVVSKALVEAGLVEDASEFDQYLVDNGYSKRINPGTYDIPLNLSLEEIAKIITRSR